MSYDMGGLPLRDVVPPMPIHALATALANAPPEQQRTVSSFLLLIFLQIWVQFSCFGFLLYDCCGIQPLLILSLVWLDAWGGFVSSSRSAGT